MKKSVYLRLLLQLAVVIIVSISLLALLLYHYTSNLLKDEIVGANNELLLQTSKIVDQSLHEVQQMTTSLSLNSSVLKSAVLPWNLEDEYRFLLETSQTFETRLTSSNYIHSIYLYSANNKKLISSSGITGLNEFSNRETLERFLQSKLTSSWEATRLVSRDNGEEHFISYMVSTPLRNQKKLGVLMINLKEDVLYNAVVNTNNRKLGNVAILNSDGEVLSYKDKSVLLDRFDWVDMSAFSNEKNGYFVQNIDGMDMFITYLRSPFNDWIYVTLNPYNDLFKRSYDVIIMTLIISATGLIVGLLLAFIISNRHYRPIRSMVQALAINTEGRQKHQDEFSYIRTSIDAIQLENTTFRQKFQSQELLLRDHLLTNLLSGKLSDEAETRDQLRYYHMDLGEANYIVLVLRVHLVTGHNAIQVDEKMKNWIYFQIRTICEQLIAETYKGAYISAYHKHDVLILHHEDWQSEERQVEEMKRFAAKIQQQAAEDIEWLEFITVGIGGKYERLTDIHLSYEEAVEVLNYEKVSGMGSILSIHDLNVNRANRNSFINYQQYIERLTGELKSGNFDKAVATKAIILEQVQQDEQSGMYLKHVILSHLFNALVKVRIELSLPEEEIESSSWHYEFMKLRTTEEISSYLLRIMEGISRSLESRSSSKHSEVMMKLVAYIREHYQEPLSLQLVSDMIYMNSNYVSKLFKDATGMTFIDYLTEIRFKEACRLLTETDCNINEVAELSGFSNKQSLNRTLKKLTGMTPTEYRNKEIEKRL
ncbi:AraC family transcriptional regulator [Paenibacillus pinisoli]|uniref:AraC family transcriptional regulator n=1 Tax=Paenibacillus pinisoli TaxID=1276110 RepID=A0A3A6PI06_9BACL|nr:helix-turn-helix domain-containing protein [Paenibacillus pinisoli]RJX38658.1 AraC family transcriptional regulator [Paenibacillus pinisoli]